MTTAAERAKQNINAGTRAPAPAAAPQNRQISNDLASSAAGKGIVYNPGAAAAERKVLRGTWKVTVPNYDTSKRKPEFENFMGPVGPDKMVQLPGTREETRREEQNENDALKEYYLLPKDALATLQKRLERGGFLKPGTYTLGVHDNGASFKAWSDAVDLAANFYEAGNTDITVDQVIEQGSPAPDDQAELYIMPEEDIRAMIQAVAPQVFGRRADEGTIEALVATFQQTQASRQMAGMNADAATPSGAWVQEQLRELNPESANAFQTAGKIQAFMKAINPEGEFSAYRQ